MQLLLKRTRLAEAIGADPFDTTFGNLFIDGVRECYTLEDAVREMPGVAVVRWKIRERTAIPSASWSRSMGLSASHRITMEVSQRFGPDTITINDVSAFDHIRMHSGIDIGSTEGCVCVGDTIDTINMTISGGLVRGVLARLKAKVKAALAVEPVWITIENA